MRVLITGSRSWTDRTTIERVIADLPAGTTIIHGGAHGADTIAGDCATARGLAVEVYPVTPAEWTRYGKAAGPMRNARMLAESRPDLVIAFRAPGVSKGTDGMVRLAREAGLRMTVVSQRPAGPNSVELP
jgi:hypothetical protein